MTPAKALLSLTLLATLGLTISQPQPRAEGCVCGLEGKERIVGGQIVTRGKYPWMASIIKNNSSRVGGCGATLIASRWAVTAAHCISFRRPITSIVLGEHDISGIDDLDINRVVVRVEAMIPHEKYGSPKSMSNDIALLKLAEDVDLSVHTPACLPSPGSDYTGQTGVVYGWGRTDPCTPGLSKMLREVEVEIVSDAECEKSSGYYYSLRRGECQRFFGSYEGYISEEMVCAGARNSDSCQGDSGGPFTVKEDTEQHSLVGVVSWGLGCAADSFYGVYSEVANPKIRAWIDNIIAQNGGATYCPSKN